ncbi:pseudouridine synthase [Thermodesulfobacteriota bacterium]
MTTIRLQKYIAHAGVCSRRQAEAYIRQGRVKVNGEVVTRPGTRVDEEEDRVAVDGKVLCDFEPSVYIVLNKPEGYVTSCRHRGEKVVLDLLDVKERVYPVGRLDKDSTGLLLLTNDGGLHLKLTHPSFEHEKEYDVTVLRSISDEEIATLEEGVALEGAVTLPTRIRRLGSSRFAIVLREGKKRQIRRMVEKVGNSVLRLHRIRMGTLDLGNLQEGRWRYLTEEERTALLRLVDSDK